eukprot:1159284-Pelagomonas_calceolata.AAC.1
MWWSFQSLRGNARLGLSGNEPTSRRDVGLHPRMKKAQVPMLALADPCSHRRSSGNYTGDASGVAAAPSHAFALTPLHKLQKQVAIILAMPAGELQRPVVLLHPCTSRRSKWRYTGDASEQVASILETPVKELQRPYKLAAELGATHDWVLALAHHKYTHVRGLLHFDLTNC